MVVKDYFFPVSCALYTALQYCVPCTICNLSIVKANKHKPAFTLISVNSIVTAQSCFIAVNWITSKDWIFYFSVSVITINIPLFLYNNVVIYEGDFLLVHSGTPGLIYLLFLGSCRSSPLLPFVHPPFAFDLRGSSPIRVQMFLNTVPATWLWRSTSSLPTGIEQTAVMCWIVSGASPWILGWSWLSRLLTLSCSLSPCCNDQGLCHVCRSSLFQPLLPMHGEELSLLYTSGLYTSFGQLMIPAEDNSVGRLDLSFFLSFLLSVQARGGKQVSLTPPLEFLTCCLSAHREQLRLSAARPLMRCQFGS